MELFLQNGDYLPDGRGGFQRAQGRGELLQRVLWKLTARRGAFPFLPQLGSRLYTLTREKPSAWQSLAQEYVTEALTDETDLTVTGVEAGQEEGRLTLKVGLEWQGETLDIKLDLEDRG